MTLRQSRFAAKQYPPKFEHHNGIIPKGLLKPRLLQQFHAVDSDHFFTLEAVFSPLCHPPIDMSLGGCISYRDDDEPVEIVPRAIRLRKKKPGWPGIACHGQEGR